MQWDPEALRDLNVLGRKLMGDQHCETNTMLVARNVANPQLVFVGRAGGVHLFLRNPSVRALLNIKEWTQRGDAAQKRNPPCFFFWSKY